MLGQYLPELEACAGPGADGHGHSDGARDITTQLGMVAPKRFIHGFRRENLAIEVVESSGSREVRVICSLVGDARTTAGHCLRHFAKTG